jgi:dTDP-glucose 4,6-dehydratase
MKKLLVSGNAGFILSSFIEMYQDHGYQLVCVDKVIAPYSMKTVQEQQCKFYMGDIADSHFMNNVFAMERPDLVLHGAAESFVDDSIRNALSFAHSNVLGTQVMIDMALKYRVEKFLYVSTDEIYGQLGASGSWTEESIPRPRNPYSASKYAGELMVYAANQTHGLNYNITRCSNNFGKRQPPRNLVPKIITCTLNSQPIPIHGSGKQFREWLYVNDHCSALLKVLEDGTPSEIYNIGSGVELTNLEMVEKIGQMLDKKPLINFVNDRPGHDFRYSVDCSKIKKLGWFPKTSFNDGMRKTISWYAANPNFYV